MLAPDSLDENAGTAEILRLPEIREIVKGNFIVLPCDLVCELGGEKLIQAWMVSAASLGDVLEDQSFSGGAARNKHSGGIGVWYNTKIATPIKGEETDFIMTAALRPVTATLPKDSILPHVSSLVYSLPTDSLKDLTEEKKGLPIRLGLLRKHPRIRMLTTHRDAHIYIFPKWVLDFVKENEKLDSIGEDVIGWWAKATWQTGLPEKLSMAEALEPEAAKKEEDDSSQEDSTPPQDEDSAELLLRPPGASHAAGHAQGTDAAAKPGAERVVEMPPFLAYVHPSQAQGVVRRVDTAQLLLSVSLQLAKLPSLEDSGADHQEPSSSPFAHARKVAYPEGVKARTTITRADSLVAENVTVEEKAAVKESVVGANCQLREGARLTQCLLMEGVVVGRNCKLTRCILGRRCEIGEGSVLTDCEVQENLLVEPRSKSSRVSPNAPVWNPFVQKNITNNVSSRRQGEQAHELGGPRSRR